MVHAVIRNKDTNEVALLKWKKQPWTSFIIGGAEEGEDLIEAAKREAEEEGGFKNLKFVKFLNKEPVISEYYAAHKNENRYAHSSGILFEVDSKDRNELSAEENEKHEVFWYPMDKLSTLKMTCAEKDIWLNGIEDKFFHTEKGILVNSGEFTGMTSDEAFKKITEHVGGKLSKNYRLRDWLISRQRYWGCPIPMVHCSKCGVVPVPERDLPIRLPDLDNYLPREDGKSPLAKSAEWLGVKCPKCGGDAERETDTLDTFIDSSWYYLRYIDPNNSDKFADAEKIKSWMPVKFYSGGAEHTTMHLLFARFFYKVLFDLGLVAESEPFTNRLNRGLILGPDGNKMSKSKGNVIEPDPLVEKVGADTVRMYLAFIGPYNEVGSYPWDPNGVVGMRRFLERVWKLSENLSSETSHEVNVALHKLIKRVGEEFTQLKFNAGIAQLMSFSNLVEKQGISKAGFSDFLKLLSTCAPHICEEMWSNIGNEGMVSEAQWPKFDEAVFANEDVSITVQVNGKMRAVIKVNPEISEAELTSQVMILPEIIKWIDGKDVKKTIYVKGRIFNIVI